MAQEQERAIQKRIKELILYHKWSKEPKERKFYLSEKRVRLDISDKGLSEGFGIKDIVTLIVVVLPTIVIAIVVPLSRF